MTSLLNFPETYAFKCTNETLSRIFRYPNNTNIEFSNIEYKSDSSNETSINLSGKKIVLMIGERDPKKIKSKVTHCGTLMNYEEDVSILLAYEKSRLDKLINSVENIGKN